MTTLSTRVFWETYTEALHWSLKHHPERYGYGPEEIPGIVTRMRSAAQLRRADLSSPAFARTCRMLGIPHTARAIYTQIGLEV